MIRSVLAGFVDRPVLVELVVLLIVVTGVVSAWWIPKEEFPQVATDQIAVTAVWPGATAEDLEDAVIRPLERALEALPDRKRTLAEASRGRAVISLQLATSTDASSAAEAARRRIADVVLPDDVLTPKVEVREVRLPLVYVALLGDPRQSELAQSLAAELRGLADVMDVAVVGAWTPEVRVDLDPTRSNGLGVSPREVASALGAAGHGTPLGALGATQQGPGVQTPRGVHELSDLGQVPLQVGGGSHYTVHDVATVTEPFVAPDVTMRVNGQPGIGLVVERTADADALTAVARVRAWASHRQATLPSGLELVVHDGSDYLLGHRMRTLANNALMGVLLVFGVLSWVIGWRNSTLVSIGIPVALLGGLTILYLAGLSVNLISLFAMLLITGIIVDDAVVIVENVQRHLELGADRRTAALAGTLEIMGAVFAATLTTCLAFAPLLLLEGLVGRILRIVPIVVVLSLLVSLVEAFVILPSHLSSHGERVAKARDPAPLRWLRGAYARLLDRVLEPRVRNRALLGTAATVLLALLLPVVLPVSLTPLGRPVFAIFEIVMVPDATVEQTSSAARTLEVEARRLPPEQVRFVRTRLGQGGAPDEPPAFGRHRAQVVFGFRDDPAAMDVVERFLQDAVRSLDHRADVSGVSLRRLTGGPPVGKPLDVRLRGEDPNAVLTAATAAIEHLTGRPGVIEVTSDGTRTATSIAVRVLPEEAARFGLREATVASRVRSLLEGVIALELPFDGELRQVKVSAPPVASPAELADRVIEAPDGRRVRIGQVADVGSEVGVERLTRVDGQRSVRVSAEIDASVTSVRDERAAIEAAMAAMPGVTLSWGGEAADLAESFGRLPVAAALALLLVYGVLAVQFGSYVQPLLVMLAVPLGLAGVTLGLAVFGMELSLVAMVGAVGLIGIVVNDSLLLVERFNQLRRRGTAPLVAIREASLTRLRPILITSVTTIAGLFPMAVGLGGREPLLAPMAVAVGVGLLFATGLTLLALPLSAIALEDLRAPRSS